MTKRWCTNKIIPHFYKNGHFSKAVIVITKYNQVILTSFIKNSFLGDEEIKFYSGIVPYNFEDVKYWAYIDTFFKEEINDKDTN